MLIASVMSFPQCKCQLCLLKLEVLDGETLWRLSGPMECSLATDGDGDGWHCSYPPWAASTHAGAYTYMQAKHT